MKRTLLITALVALGLAAWLVSRRGPAPDPGATIPSWNTGHPILLVVDAEGIEGSRPRRDADRWYDLEWVNLLTQGFGGCDVASTSEAAGLLAGRQLVVIPRRTAANLDAALVDLVETRVRDGLNVLVEAPDSSLCKRMGLELAAVERRPQLPWPTPLGSSARPQMRVRPQPVPVAWTRFRYAPRSTPSVERPSVRMNLDGRPMGWSCPVGDGAWLVLAADLAELSSRLRQGENGTPILDGPDHAWVDAWVEGVFGASLTRLPLPRIATAPPAADGWLVAHAASDSVERAAVAPGWSWGSAVPVWTLLPGGQLSAETMTRPVLPATAGDADPRLLDRWARNNAEEGGGPLVVEFTGQPPAGWDDLARRRNLEPAGSDLLARWWSDRTGVRVRVSAAADDVEYRIEALPDTSPGFGLLVPVSWRERTLEGWDADWGLVAGRKVQRFDRAYRLLSLEAAAEGGVIRFRYR